MIELFLRKLAVRSRIVGGFLVMVILLAMAIPVLIGNHNFIVGRLQHVTKIETRADRLLLLASTRVMSSRLNLLRYFQDYLPSAWVAMEDSRQATELLNEAESLIKMRVQRDAVSSIIEKLDGYIALIKSVQDDAVEGKQSEAARKVFLTLKTGNDITLMIEQVVRDSEVHVADTNETVNRETRTRLDLVVAGFGFVLVISLVFSLLVSHSITRPLTDLRKGTDEFGLGHMDFRISASGKDELSLLARTFNNMAEQLQSSFASLEQREKTITEERNLLRTLIDNLPDQIYVKNSMGRFILANQTFVKSLNIKTPEEIDGKTDFDLFPADLAQVNYETDSNIITSGEPVVNSEKAFIDPESGKERWLLTTSIPLSDSQSHISGLVCLSRDITEKKKSEEELKKHRDHLEELVKERMEEISRANEQLRLEITERKKVESALMESEEKYRTLYVSMKEGVCLHEILYDRSGKAVDYKILDVNPSYEFITGLSRDTAVGSHASQIYGDAPFLSVCTKVVATGNPESFETYWASKGKYLRVSAFSPGKDQFALVFSDITEKHHLEARLRQAQKMESIGTLAGGIAHDFNNILGIILGNTELALDDLKDRNTGKQYLREILSASLRAKDVIHQILSFARKSIGERNPVKMGTIIQESLKLLRSSIPSTIEIDSSIIHINDTVLADPTQINQVLMNLCTNATHAMRDHSGILKIDLDHVDLDQENAARLEGLIPGKYVVLTVTDTGHGIPPQIMDRVFDPYYTTKKMGDGTGMGLAVVHGIIKNHDGAVFIQSEPGKGTNIKVFFPFVDMEAIEDIEMINDLPRGSETILYVDDEVSLVQIVKRMLERLGYTVETRTNSIEALELFSARPNQFDLVITDMTMPYMTGDELARQLISVQKRLPVILCTGYSDLIDEEKARTIGIKAYILKPIVMSELAMKLREILDSPDSTN